MKGLIRRSIATAFILWIGFGPFIGQAEAEITAELKNGPELAAAVIQPEQSQFRVLSNVRFEDLATLLNRFNFKIESKGTTALFVPYDGVITINHVVVTQSSKTTFPLRIKAPFHVVGHFANHPIDESGTAITDVAVSIGDNWCPVLQFDQPAVALDSDAPALADISVPTVKDWIAIYLLKRELNGQFTCQKLKDYIAQAWRQYELPVTVAGNKLYVSVEPKEVELSAVKATNNHLIFTAVITASMALRNTSVQKPTEPVSLNVLPAPKRIPLVSGPRDVQFQGIVSVNPGK